MEQVAIQTDERPSTESSNFFNAAPAGGYVTLFYDPPYASELDDALARHLVAYLVPAASLDYKAYVWAAHSRCRFDFLIDLGTRRIAIDYSDTPENVETALVEDNDALGLGTGVVDTILRVRRQDLEDHMYDCLHVIAKWEPNLFTPYGQRMFAARSSAEARSILPEPESDLVSIYYPRPATSGPALVVKDAASSDEVEWPEIDDDLDYVVMRRMSRERPDVWQRQYERAALVYGRSPIRRTRWS